MESPIMHSDLPKIAKLYEELTPRNKEFVQIAASLTLRLDEIADKMGISETSMPSMLSSIASKLGIPTGPQIERRAIMRAVKLYAEGDPDGASDIIEQLENDTLVFGDEDKQGAASASNGAENWLQEMAGNTPATAVGTTSNGATGEPEIQPHIPTEAVGTSLKTSPELTSTPPPPTITKLLEIIATAASGTQARERIMAIDTEITVLEQKIAVLKTERAEKEASIQGPIREASDLLHMVDEVLGLKTS